MLLGPYSRLALWCRGADLNRRHTDFQCGCQRPLIGNEIHCRACKTTKVASRRSRGVQRIELVSGPIVRGA
jgi:hypothetical protein